MATEKDKLERRLKALISKKETLYLRAQTLYDVSKTIDNETSQKKFSVLYESLDRTRSDFEAIIDLINDVSMQMDPEHKPSFKALNSFDELYCHIQAVARDLSAKRTAVTETPPADSKKPIPRLPKLQIPTFNGDLKTWEIFYECFKSLIHENKDLTSVDKVHYLMGALTGSAKSAFSGLPPTGENYSIIWNGLVEKYQDNRKLATSYLEAILDFKTLQSESANNLNSFLEKFVPAVSALKKLPVSDLFDFTLSYIALGKLDSESRRTFEMLRTKNADIPTYEEIVDFVKSRAKVLMSGSSKTSTGFSSFNKSSNSSGISKPKVTHSFIVKNSESDRKCAVCTQDVHRLNRCPKFLKYTPKERYDFVKSNYLCLNCLCQHKVMECKSKFSCTTCHKRHHSLLHFENSATNSAADYVGDSPTEPSVTNTMCSTTSISRQEQTFVVVLSTVVANFVDGENNTQTVRFLLDSASQGNIITRRCAKRLKLSISKFSGTIMGLGSKTNPVLGKTKLVVASRFGDCKKFTVDSLVVDRISDKLPNFTLPLDSFSFLRKVPLADESFYQPDGVDGILGAEIFASALGRNRISGPLGTPVAIETDFGYVIMGKVPVSDPYFLKSTNTFCSFVEPSLEGLMTKFWEIEEISAPSVLNKEDYECEQIFSASYSRKLDGSYIVKLPFKKDPSVLGDSYTIAYKRFLSLERKLEASHELRMAYNQAMQDYIAQGHISVVGSNVPVSPGYYIPHHGVFKDSSSTPLRIVFDAGAKTDSSLSLNDILYTGPKLQADVVTMLLNYRIFEIAMTADIRQMYRMIGVCNEHRKFQRLLWRFSPNDPLLIYELTTVVFGLNSSPYLALRTVRQLASDEARSYPKASKAVFRDMYMDDYVTSVANLEEARSLFQEMVDLFKSGGFDLVKWCSNSEALLSDIPENLRSTQIVQFCTETLKILGLQWHPRLDILSFKVNFPDIGCTKRQILSTIARIYDPLGILAPVILYAKLLMKELWLLKVDWDEKLPDSVSHKWAVFSSELSRLLDFKIPRHLGIFVNSSIVLVGFTDASERAYGGVIYVRVCMNGNITSSLVIAKSRVSPLKVVSIPRLELMAINLLAKLMRFVIDNFSSQPHFTIDGVFAFSDSKVALSWINASPHRWKTFVANRVAKIQELLPPCHWYHVKGEENPADYISRGMTPSQLVENPVWTSGPSWILLDKDNWPIQSFTDCNTSLEEKPSLVAVVSLKKDDSFYDELIAKFSCWKKLIKTMVFILRFCRILPSNSSISSVDTSKAERYLIRLVQLKYFSEDIHLLENGKECSPYLRKLRPFIKDGILLVGGRLSNSKLTYCQKHPILLPKSEHFVNLLIDFYHRKTLHTGPHLTLALLRQQYWISSARGIVRRRIQGCNICFRSRPMLQFPLMTDLPACRVQEAKAFTHTGLDYAGPVLINISRTRGAKTQKAYICLFICLATKALHLELVSDLSTANFLQALKRFLSRRGPCRVIFSDCGTNFIGAKNVLDDLYTLVNSKEYQNKFAHELAFNKIEWKFNPPSAPHFGGIWEANVKVVKSHLYRVIGQQILSYEEFNTLLIQIEALLNSRPLCILSSDPADPVALTPAHFLNLTPLEALPNPDLSDKPLNRLDRYQLIDRMVQDYWRRWHLEYLNTLQTRERWNKISSSIVPGTVVVVKQDNTPPMQWPLAVVEEVFPSKDSVIRVVSIRTKQGVFKRPVVKICPLPTQ